MSNVTDPKVFGKGLHKKKVNTAMDQLEEVIGAMARDCGCEVAGWMANIIASARKLLTPVQVQRLKFELNGDPENPHRIDGFIVNYLFGEDQLREIIRIESVGVESGNLVSLLDPVRSMALDSVNMTKSRDYLTIVTIGVIGGIWRELTKNPSNVLHYDKVDQRVCLTLKRKDYPGCVRMTMAGAFVRDAKD